MSTDNVVMPNPQFGWSPKQFVSWWLTPRSNERGAKFRERVIRASTLILIVIVLFVIFFLFPVLEGSPEAKTNRLVTVITFEFLLLVPFFLAHRGYLVVAGWTLLAMPSFGFLTLATSLGIWLNISLFFLLLVCLYGQVVLPRQQIPYLIILSFGLVFFIQLFHIPETVLAVSPAEILQQLISLYPATILTLIMLVVFNLLLYILRREFDSRQDELQGFVSELDNRVQERTAQLQERTKELDIARQKAEDANTIKTKFLANMSHELRTPLNAILNFTAFVADGVVGEVNHEQEDMLRQSIGSGKHLLALINDILDVTKIEAGLMDLFIQQVDFNETLGAVVAIGKGLSKDKPVQLITDIQDKMPIGYGDKRRIRQVFLNILSNAFKFTREGSVTVYAHATASHIHVKITDTGVGISPENYELVFESFKQAQNDNLEVVGTGLGMPISKYFVESHHGKIWFESTVGVGTTFYVELPILTEEEANALRLEVV
ncbi:MAG: ATP-binding protein [Anaerolineae bacterium]|nr:ATP-binding protein [Anaerolineae bacterium]